VRCVPFGAFQIHLYLLARGNIFIWFPKRNQLLSRLYILFLKRGIKFKLAEKAGRLEAEEVFGSGKLRWPLFERASARKGKFILFIVLARFYCIPCIFFLHISKTANIVFDLETSYAS